MQAFTLSRPTTAPNAVAAARAAQGVFIAGGTDLLQLMKEQVSQPAYLVDVLADPALRSITSGPSGVTLGATATMSEVAERQDVRRSFPVLVEALLEGASPQVRNMATIGGNLLQRTRCPYFRDVGFGSCNKRQPGSGCPAQDGDNRNLAILGVSDWCIASHASDLAVALVALGASVRTLSPQGGRNVALGSLYRLPGRTPHFETVLEPGELIIAVQVPASGAARRSRYLKVRDRASFEFAVVSAAVGLDLDGDRVRDARVAAGGVGTRPWRLPAVEQALRGRRLTPAAVKAAAARAPAGSRPREHNRFKVQLLANTVERALLEVGGLA